MAESVKTTDQEVKVDREGKYLTFTLAKEEYGIGILKVKEIIGMMPITTVPRTPGFVKGVINLRGKVIPVIDLRGRFNLERREHDKSTRIIVVELRGTVVGFVVDAVREVLRIPRTVTEPPPAIAAGSGEKYITGVARLDDRLLMLLDLEKAVENDPLSDAV